MKSLPLHCLALCLALCACLSVVHASESRIKTKEAGAAYQRTRQEIHHDALKAFKLGESTIAASLLDELCALEDKVQAPGKRSVRELQHLSRMAAVLHNEGANGVSLVVKLASQRHGKAAGLGREERAQLDFLQARLLECHGPNPRDARALYQSALKNDPAHRGAQDALARIQARDEADAQWTRENEALRKQAAEASKTPNKS